MRSLLVAFLLSLSLFFVAPVAHAQDAAKPASAFSDAQRAELTSLIREFIVDNPQALIASVEGFYNKQNAEKEKQEGPIKDVPAGLYDSATTPSVGPKDAKLTVVYFFDYNCGFCKQVDRDFARLIAEEKNVRFLFKELPILNETSELGSRWALAANKQGKYMDFHSALMQHTGKIDEEALTAIAKEKGLDVAKLKVDMMDPAISESLQKDLDMARELGVRGTPFFLFGKEKVPGAIAFAKMKEQIVKQRDGIVVPQAAKDAAAEQRAEGLAAETQAAAAPSAPAVAPAISPEAQAEIDKIREEAKKELGEITKEAGVANPMDPKTAAPAAPVKK